MIKVKSLNNVTQIKSGRSFWGRVPHFNYCFLIDDLLIDTGPPCCQYEYLEFCKGKNISRAINTHHHEDHVGGNKILQDNLRLEIYAHPSAVKRISDMPRLQLYRKIIWGKPENSTVRPISVSIQTNTGRTLKIIHTPGHCEDHICLFDESEGSLFTGDAFLHSKIKVFRNDENFHESLNSLNELLKLNPKILYCSLNGRLLNASEQLKKKIDFMNELAFNAHKLFESGMPQKKIKKILLGSENSFYYLTLGHFSKQNLIDAILTQAVPVVP